MPSTDWRIIISDGLEAEGRQRLAARAEVVDDPGLKELGQADAVIVRSATQVTPAVLEAAVPRLKVVGRAGVGVDNIDLEAALRHGVVVVNAPLAATNAVAELTLGLMLSMARQIPQANASMHAGRWDKKALKGSELGGKTLGVFGMGRIGAAVAERALALGMTVVGYDPLIPADEIEHRGATPVSQETLLETSDYISLHVPLTEETRGLIGSGAMARMKPGVRLVCAARGGVVDESALLDALQSGQVAGAALDVFAAEPPGASPLIAHPNLIATPHLGAQTAEAQSRAAVDIADEVLAALDGRPLRWRVA
jgi:D-3-phosphoglycerate dehydrogenase / 2-oxoglutarate reductase